MRHATALAIGFATLLFAFNAALGQQNSPVRRAVSLHPGSDQARGEAFCKSRHAGPELQKLLMSGEIGKNFIVGDLAEISGRNLTVKLLKGDIPQQVEVADNVIICLQDKGKEPLQSISVSDLKVGNHVFGPGKLDHGVFVMGKVLYVLIFESDATSQQTGSAKRDTE
jgi:hypothetical protein